MLLQRENFIIINEINILVTSFTLALLTSLSLPHSISSGAIKQ